MEGWREYSLQDVIDTFIDYRGKTPPKSDTGVPLITAKIVKDGKLLPANEFVAEQDYLTWMTRGFPQKGDVVLTTEAPLGELAIINDPKVALGQRIIILRGKKFVLDNYFLKYYLQSSIGQGELEARSSGTTVFGIKASLLRELPILIPNYIEQQAIAAVLSCLDDKIDLLHRQNKTLEALAQTLFRQWFVEEAEEGEEKNITDFIDFNPKRELKKDTVAPYIEMSALSSTSFAPSTWYEREFSSGTKFINGDTLLARITPCLENGKAAFIQCLQDGETAWGSTEYIVLRPKKNLHPLFAYSLVKTPDFREYAESCLAGSSGRQRIELQHLMQYDLIMPTQAKIYQFNTCMESLLPRLTQNANQIHTLTKLRDTLLPKLMSGEVRVAH